jgi:LmbE family N-acetylglucosaminyl deacetylase
VPKTLVCFHAHPDDEAIATGGTMLRAKQRGHRVVLVLATRGEVGEVADGFLADGETLEERRTTETLAAAAVLGVDRVEFLGYRDSGMDGTDTTGHPDAFWTADVEEAAGRLAALLRDERADVLTVYDDHGAYGHPDHVQVHRVGVRAGQLAGTPVVYESTINRDQIIRLVRSRPQDMEPDGPTVEELDSFGSPEDLITTVVDVRELVDAKRRAMAAHASQIPEESFFLAMPDEAFEETFGWEWFIRHGRPRRDGEPIAVLDDLVDGSTVDARPDARPDGGSDRDDSRADVRADS